MKIISLKKIFSNTTGQFLMIGLLSLSACKDEPARLTGDVLPEGEVLKGLNYNKHVLSTMNTTRDAIKTSQATSGVLGTFNDPVFGKSEGSFVTDFSIGDRVYRTLDVYDAEKDTVYEDLEFFRFNNNIDTIADVWKVDSLVLSLQYQFNDWYGDMLDEQEISIYELQSGLGSSNTEYFHNSDVPAYNPIAVAKKIVHPNNDVPDTLKSTNWSDLWQDPDSLLGSPEYLWNNSKAEAAIDSGWLAKDAYKASTKYWNFKLNDDIRDRFFNLDESALKNTNAFKNEFFGLYIDSESNSDEGALTKINLPTYSSPNYATILTLYYSRDYKYKNSAEEVRDTTEQFQYKFPINVENVRFNKYEHTFNTENIEIDKPNPEVLYLQGMAGSYTRFQFPDEILNWVDSLANKDPYMSVSNIEFFMEIDTMSLVDRDAPGFDPTLSALKRYPIPQNLNIVWQDHNGKMVTPVYDIIVGGQKISTPVFGSNANQNGQRSGTGDLKIRQVVDDEGNISYEYLYHFILRADFFNYIMRNEDGASFNEKEFFIGPGNNSTANFQRVTLFGGANPERPMEINIKYFHYIPR